MSLKRNFSIIGKHAFLSPSTYHWLEYDDEKLRRVYFQRQQAALGDKTHTLAQQLIELGIRLPDNKTTLSMYVNDAIGFRMEAEVPLVYSDECFGTADACGYRVERGIPTLRISDLKTGINPADMRQLKIYAAIFFYDFEFHKDVDSIFGTRIILRIYQNDAIVEEEADPAEILQVMERIKYLSEAVASLRKED
jgi:hypothetical protein